MATMSAAAACETAGRGEMAAAGLRRGGGSAGVAAPCVYIWERETGVGGGWFWGFGIKINFLGLSNHALNRFFMVG